MKLDNLDQLNQLVDNFISLAAKKEKVPPKTDDIKTLLSTLSSLENFQTRLAYANKNVDKISSGSSRAVFDLPNNQVLKLASNEKGLYQNAAEAKIKTDSPYVNLVLDHCPNFTWVTTNKADKITPKQFEQLSQIPFDLFADAIRAKIKKENPKKLQPYLDHPMVNDIAKITKQHQLMTGDLARISSYGAINDQLVLIDLGLTREIYKQFYATPNSQKLMSKHPSAAE